MDVKTSLSLLAKVVLALSVAVNVGSAVATGSTCDGVDQSLSKAEAERLNQIVLAQLEMKGANVMQSFLFRSWRILYVEIHQSDEVYLFYKHDPSLGRYDNMWSGAARRDEALQTKDWMTKNVHNIPPPMARCFAWHVTKGRNL